MSIKYHIRPFGKGITAPINELALLHSKLLPTSPVAKLGYRFMTKFYYNELPKGGYIFGAIAYVDKLPVGFISATSDSNGFMQMAIKKLRWKLILTLGINILLHPRNIFPIREAWKIMESRKTRNDTQLVGEILSIGVLPDYINFRFIHKTGLHITNDLFQAIMAQTQMKDVKLIRALVDIDNPTAQLFYHGRGWKLQRVNNAGWKTPVVEFVWTRREDEVV